MLETDNNSTSLFLGDSEINWAEKASGLIVIDFKRNLHFLFSPLISLEASANPSDTTQNSNFD